MVSFLFNDFIRRNPDLTRDAQDKEEMTIRYNVRVHGAETLRGQMAQIMNTELKDWRIYSLSKRYDNMSLWAKYAANHTGYCLEFANDGQLFVHAMEVTYRDSVQMDLNNREHRNGYWFFSKRQEWSNEEEVRLVLPRGNPCKVKIDPRWLTRLILGKDMSVRNQTLVREWAKQREPELTVVGASYDALRQVLALIP